MEFRSIAATLKHSRHLEARPVYTDIFFTERTAKWQDTGSMS